MMSDSYYVDIGEVRFNTYDCESYMRGFESHMSTYPTNASAIKTIMVPGWCPHANIVSKLH